VWFVLNFKSHRVPLFKKKKKNSRRLVNLGDPGIDGRIILRWIFRNWNEGYGPDQAGSG
jgi:hypothetical protein